MDFTSLNLLDLSSAEFVKGLQIFYQFKDIWYGLVKAASFGAAVTLIGCLQGLATRGGAAGVGRRDHAGRGATAARRSWCWTRSGRVVLL